MESQDQADNSIDRDSLLSRVRVADFFLSEGWEDPSGPLDLGSLRWAPSFVKQNSALAVILGTSVPNFLERRLRAARAAGIEMLCVVDLAALSSKAVLLLLSDLNARVSLVEDGVSLSQPMALLKFLGCEEFAVEPEGRRHLISNGLAACREASTSDAKGKTLEWLLHFMFSQVRDFRVRSCNYRTASEELDVVVQLTSWDPARCWAHLGAPFLIAEAKNRKERSGQEVVSKLNTIISLKRGTCKIGFIVSLSGFTSDAHTQVLKLAAVDRTFVLLNAADLERWGFAQDYDNELNEIVMEAMLE
jgi:hypothetical protein